MDHAVDFLGVDSGGDPRNRLLCILLRNPTLTRHYNETSRTSVAPWGIDRMKRLRIDEKIDLLLDSKFTLRIYADCRPRVFQTAKLQKGAIIVHNGMELVEEGLGIGVPVCRYRDGTRFSLSAETFVDDSNTNPTVVKIFDMNGVASKRFRGSPMRRNSCLTRLLKLMEKGYRRVRRFRTEATLMLNVFSLLGMRNEYSESGSKGQITVTYCRSGRELKINATVDGLSSEGLESIVFANEQGGRIFGEYADSTGIELHERQIEPWQMTEAKWASLHSGMYDIGFTLHRASGWLIVRGREVVRDRISWSGLDLFRSRTPQALEYLVEIGGASS
jgi:hypothetical protein